MRRHGSVSLVQCAAIAAVMWALVTLGVLVGWEMANRATKTTLDVPDRGSTEGTYDRSSLAVSGSRTALTDGTGVVLTTYFTSKEDFQRKTFVAKDSYAYMQPLYESASNHGIDLVIFHDGLSRQFVERWGSPRVEFIAVKLRPTISMNDERFILYQEYLREHQTYDYVLLADVSDVELFGDPFTYIRMSASNDGSSHCKLWISQESGTGKASKWLFGYPDPCYNEPRNFVNLNIDLRRRLYNAGALAGTRQEIEILLGHMTREFARMDHHEANCNMAVLQYVIQRFYEETDICDTGMCWKDLCGSEEVVIAHKRLPLAN